VSEAPEKERDLYHESWCYSYAFSPLSACGAVEVSRKLNGQQSGWKNHCLNWAAHGKVQDNEQHMSEVLIVLQGQDNQEMPEQCLSTWSAEGHQLFL